MRAKKSLGQHFLTSTRVARAMISAADISTNDQVLEVGPGTGMLTEALLHAGARVIAIEKDARLSRLLARTFSQEIANGKLWLIEADALAVNPAALGIPVLRYKVVANIPYYITGTVIARLLSHQCQPESMTLLVQKEVAERVAKDTKGSVLSMSVRAYGTPRYVQTVSRNLFKPKPAVDSAVLCIENISRARFRKVPEARFFMLLKQGFAHKRKKLMGNLALSYPTETLINVFKHAGIHEHVRAEELSVDTWCDLARDLFH